MQTHLPKLKSKANPDGSFVSPNYEDLFPFLDEEILKQELQKAQEIKENLLGTQHLEIAGVQQLLADVYKDQGKYNEAELLYQESLQIRKKILEEEHPDTVLIYNNLAYVYQEQGKYNKAEELYQKSLQIK